MNRTGIITVFLLLCSLAANAHHHRYKRERRKIIPYTHASTANVAVGAVGGYATLGAGLEYEQFISSDGMLSGTLKGNGYMGGTIHLGELDEGEIWSKNYGFFIAPGARFHPLKNTHRVDPGLGICMPFGYGSRRDQIKGPFSFSPVVSEQVHNFFGAVLGEVTVNFQASRGGLFSFFAMGGVIYSNAKVTRVGTYNDPLYLQFGLRFGNRW